MSVHFGKYSLISRLGYGGMAEVFQGRLSGIGGFEKWVVIKRLLPSLAEEHDFVQMFMDEARLAANLNHPNIAQVFEIDMIEDIPYIAMEYVQGFTLKMLIRATRAAGRRDYAQFAYLMAGICDALSYAHSALDMQGNPLNLIHRDVTPHNILVSLEGVPKLVDFGIAKAAGRLARTQAGTIKGKVKYMSPEQLRNSEGDLDGRADVFSAGVCLFEATTGHFPFQAVGTGDLALIESILGGSYAKPSEFVPDYPPELERVVVSAIDGDPGRRCPSAQALRDELEAFVRAQPEQINARVLAGWVAEVTKNGIPRNTSHPRTGTPSMPPSLPSARRAHSSGSRSGSAKGVYIAGSGSKVSKSQELEVLESTSDGKGSWKRITTVAVAVAVGLIATVILLTRGSKSEPAWAPALVSKVEAPAVSDDAAATDYLNAVEKLAAAKRYAPALGLLEKVRALKPSDAKVVIRVVNVADTVEREAMLYQATRQIESGQYAEALETVKQILDRDPSNASARKLLTQARAGLSPASSAQEKSSEKTTSKKPPPEKSRVQPPSKKPPAKDGEVTITSTPPAMVYIDDELIGRAPIQRHSLKPGAHTVQVRLLGYQPAQRSVDVVSGRELALAIALTAEASRQRINFQEDLPPAPAAATPAAGGAAAESAAATQEPVTPAPNPTPQPAATAPSAQPPAEKPGAAAPPSKNDALKKSIPKPYLPVTFTPKNPEELSRMLSMVEDQAVNTAGLEPQFVRGLTRPLQGQVKGEIYPTGIYYFLIREAAMGSDRTSAAENLRRAHAKGQMVKFKNLPSHNTTPP